jgi:hypothetical protein
VIWLVLKWLLGGVLHLENAPMLSAAIAIVIVFGGTAILVGGANRLLKKWEKQELAEAEDARLTQDPAVGGVVDRATGLSKGATGALIFALVSARTGVPTSQYLQGARVRLTHDWQESALKLVPAPLIALGIGAFGVFYTARPTTCGGQVMQSGDRCVSLNSGSSVSKGQMDGAIASQPWFWLVIVLLVLGYWALQWKWYRIPSADNRIAMARTITEEREALRAAAFHETDPAIRARVTDYATAYHARSTAWARRWKVPLD